jgi:ribosomal protein S18 acetylase RimI-like enzyme
MIAQQNPLPKRIGMRCDDPTGFQAPEFYQKLGYEVLGVLEDYPRHHKNYSLRKHLG